jgi:hypothetical protein
MRVAIALSSFGDVFLSSFAGRVARQTSGGIEACRNSGAPVRTDGCYFYLAAGDSNDNIQYVSDTGYSRIYIYRSATDASMGRRRREMDDPFVVK